MPHDDPAAIAKAITAALRLPPHRRVGLWRELAREAGAVFGAAGDADIVAALDELEGTGRYRRLAETLGVAESTINKAVSQHRARLRAAAPEEQPSCPTSPDNPSTT